MIDPSPNAEGPEPLREQRAGPSRNYSAVTEIATSGSYQHPIGRCQNIQCAACFNLTDPTKPVERPGLCSCGNRLDGDNLCMLSACEQEF